MICIPVAREFDEAIGYNPVTFLVRPFLQSDSDIEINHPIENHVVVVVAAVVVVVDGDYFADDFDDSDGDDKSEDLR